jgi:prepilin-type N-terminal cleavage/methylation domain-containing protein
MRKQSAFTLIELLVVIAIIAILAAILFPVFAQAKEAAKKAAHVSNIKQTATSMVLYTNDYDDHLPFGMIKLASGAWAQSTLADLPANWRTDNAAFVERHSRMWANSIQPYMKNYDLLRLDGGEIDPAGTTGIRQPATAGLRFNGLLQSWPSSSVDQISRLTMLWYGYGKYNREGFVLSQPTLRCSSTSDICRFNPGGSPDPGAAAGTFGHVFINPSGGTRSFWVFTHGMIFAHVDTSAKFRRIGTMGPGTVENVNDPFAEYGANGVPVSRYNCFTKGANSPTGYWCQMRPDFTFNFNDYD